MSETNMQNNDEQVENLGESERKRTSNDLLGATYIICCGLGGCWSGYTHAKVVIVDSLETAINKAIEFGCDEFRDSNMCGPGYSADAFEVPEGVDISKTLGINSICGGRLKMSAISMIRLNCT